MQVGTLVVDSGPTVLLCWHCKEQLVVVKVSAWQAPIAVPSRHLYWLAAQPEVPAAQVVPPPGVLERVRHMAVQKLSVKKLAHLLEEAESLYMPAMHRY